MNKVKDRSLTESALKFKYASESSYRLAKILKLGLYLLAIISVVMSQIGALKQIGFAMTILSFAITIITDLTGQLRSNIVESAILEKQLFEIEITGSTFSKIEYDREMTNKLQELAIRKGLSKAKSTKVKHIPVLVPDHVSDDYSYLYLVRIEAAKRNYILSRFFYIYAMLLVGIVLIFITLASLRKAETKDFLQLIIGFYPLLKPIITNMSASKKAATNYVKICADIDNFFADGDDSLERLARFYYYVQNLEFEALSNCPTMYAMLQAPFKHGQQVLVRGVSERFIEATYELKTRNLMLKHGLAIPKGQDLITRREYTLEDLERRANRKAVASKKVVLKDSPENSSILKDVPKPKAEIKKLNKNSESTTRTSSNTLKVKAPSEKKTTTKKSSSETKKATTTKKVSSSTKKTTKK
jgi:hypothetical protein